MLIPMDKEPKAPPLTHTEGRGGASVDVWKLATAKTSRRKRLPPNPEVPLQNRFTALWTEEERPVTSGEMLEPCKAAQSAPRIKPVQLRKSDGW